MKPEFFELYELLPENVYELFYPIYGEKLWLMFDSRILESADNLRKIYGPINCNTWRFGGNNHYRGWRKWDCPIGAKISQHKFGRALDLVPVDAPVVEVRKEIIDDVHGYCFRFITAIEADVPWLHIDCRNRRKERDGILIFGE